MTYNVFSGMLNVAQYLLNHFKHYKLRLHTTLYQRSLIHSAQACLQLVQPCWPECSYYCGH